MGIFGKSAQEKALEAENDQLQRRLAERNSELSKARLAKNTNGTLAHEKVRECEVLTAALQSIIDLRTENCASIGKRMSNIALNALAGIAVARQQAGRSSSAIGSGASPFPVPGSASDVSPVMHRTIS